MRCGASHEPGSKLLIRFVESRDYVGFVFKGCKALYKELEPWLTWARQCEPCSDSSAACEGGPGRLRAAFQHSLDRRDPQIVGLLSQGHP